jgi:ribosomal-protein-alanine N-acetyltransferase
VPPKDEVSTGRLLLRPLPAAAAGALPGDRAAATSLIGAELSDDWPLPDLVDALPLFAARRTNQGFGAWVVIDPGSGRVIGDIGFMGPPDGNGEVEIGYSLVPAARGRGLAAEAAAALSGWALRQPGVAAVTASCEPDNIASIRTLERSGFSRDGTRETLLRWRLATPAAAGRSAG